MFRYLILFVILCLPAFSYANGKMDVLIVQSPNFYLHGAYSSKDSFTVGLNLSQNRSDKSAEIQYTGKNVADALKNVFNECRKSKQIRVSFCSRFDDLFDEEDILLPHLEKLMKGQISNPLVTADIIKAGTVRDDVSFEVIKIKPNLLQFNVLVRPEKPFLIRSGIAQTFGGALRKALITPNSFPRSKMDALIYRSASFFLRGTYIDKKSFKIDVSYSSNGSDRVEQSFSARKVQSALSNFYNSVEKSEMAKSLDIPISFERIIDLDEKINWEIEHLLSNKQGDQFVLEVKKNENEVQAEVYLESNPRVLIRVGTGNTLSVALKNAFKASIPRSKMDALSRLTYKFEMLATYVTGTSEKTQKEGNVIVTLNGDFGSVGGKGKSFIEAATEALDTVTKSSWAEPHLSYFNFRNTFDLSPEEQVSIDQFIRDFGFDKAILLRAIKGQDQRIQSRAFIGFEHETNAFENSRSFSGPDLSSALGGLLRSRNVVQEGQEFIAMESRSLEHQTRLKYMSEDERENTTEFKSFAYSNPEVKATQLEDTSDVLAATAELYCRYFRYPKVKGYVTQFTQTRYNEKEHSGKVFLMNYSDFKTIKMEVLPVEFKLSPYGMNKVRAEYQPVFGRDWNVCPHIVFKELICSH